MNHTIQPMLYTSSGYLELFIGPMFSGKTSALCNIYKQYILSNKTPIVINHSIDNRYSDDDTLMISHDNMRIPCISTEVLSDIPDNILNTSDIIIINEAQFFTNLKVFVLNLLSVNKNVYIAALDGDFRQECFGDIPYLIPHCDKLTKLTALCSQCIKDGIIGIPAPFTHRLSAETEQTIVGTTNYIPVCRKCLVMLSTS